MNVNNGLFTVQLNTPAACGVAQKWGGGLVTADILCRSVRASNYTTRSDECLKRDVQPLNVFHEYERLLSLRPLSYYWRAERLNEAMQGKP